MYFTLSATTKQGKKLLKQTTKQNQKVSLIPKSLKYSAIEMEEQLHTIGQILEENQLKEIQLILTLHDTEGKIEKAGTDYVFGPLDYQVSEGFYPTLVDVIKRDMLKETDETLSIEESFRNEKLISVLEEALEEGNKEEQPAQHTKALNDEIAPWERPILMEEPADSVEEKSEPIIETDTEGTEVASGLLDELVNEESEVDTLELLDDWTDEEINGEEEPEIVSEKEPQVQWTEQDTQTFVVPVLDEEIKENQKEIQRLTAFEYINEQYPPEEAWMKEKNQLYLNQLYTTYDLPQTYQAFLEGKQELISAGKEQLVEQLEQVQAINSEEAATEVLTPIFEERQNETNQEINDYAAEQSAKWEQTKKELEEEEQRILEEEIQKIKARYEQKREQAFSLFEERINRFTEENQTALSEEKENLLADQVNELKKTTFQDLQTAKVKIENQLNDQLAQLYHATTEAIIEKQEKIQQALMAKLPEWKQEYERKQKLEAEIQAKSKKEAHEQAVLAAKRKEQALKEEELALEKERLEQQRESERAEREARERQQEAQLEQLRQAQLNYFTAPNPPSAAHVSAIESKDYTPSKKANSINGWMVGCLVSVGLLVGGSGVFVFDQLQQHASAEENQTLSSRQLKADQVRRDYEEKLQELLTKESKEQTAATTESTTQKTEKEASSETTANTKEQKATTETTETQVSSTNEVK
ncbi:hypothetical protein ACJQ40_001974 [Enterococcus faecium]|nr:hypothetical protein [Enterococcus faecium]